MDLLKTLLEAQGGGLVQQVANRAGLDRSQANSAVAELLPSLAQSMKANIAKPGGLDSLLGAVKSGNHQRYIDNPAELSNDSAVEEGNGILGHLLGSKEVSRQVAAQAAQKTGIDAEKLKSMLPLIASMMMGSVSKQLGGGVGADAGAGAQSPMAGAAAALQNLGGNDAIGNILGQFLGGSEPGPAQQKPGGGLLNLARKFFK